jgi:hypothetical protein
MPYRFYAQELIEVFSHDLRFLENWQSVFQTENLSRPMIAEVAVFQNKR